MRLIGECSAKACNLNLSENLLLACDWAGCRLKLTGVVSRFLSKALYSAFGLQGDAETNSFLGVRQIC